MALNRGHIKTLEREERATLTAAEGNTARQFARLPTLRALLPLPFALSTLHAPCPSPTPPFRLPPLPPSLPLLPFLSLLLSLRLGDFAKCQFRGGWLERGWNAGSAAERRAKRLLFGVLGVYVQGSLLEGLRVLGGGGFRISGFQVFDFLSFFLVVSFFFFSFSSFFHVFSLLSFSRLSSLSHVFIVFLRVFSVFVPGCFRICFGLFWDRFRVFLGVSIFSDFDYRFSLFSCLFPRFFGFFLLCFFWCLSLFSFI